jgi:lipoprotein NlpD
VRLTRAIGVIGASCILGAGCAAGGRYGAESYVVRPHDTLYSIAWRYDLDYRDLVRWNHIGSDYRIAVGQVLVLKPSSRAPQARSPDTAPPAHEAPRLAASGADSNAVPKSSNASRAAGAAPASPQWVWPTERSSAPRPVPGGGILLLGQLGQVVRAACSGRVVYTGSGLRGYGNLVIIRHGENWLSAYAHNSELLVREGQDVIGGQAIAHMGTGPHEVAALYFEIRLNGKPVDPLPYLPVLK